MPINLVTTLISIGGTMKITRKILLSFFVIVIQSCDCHGVWSENIRRMNHCLESHKDNKEFCEKQMDKVGSCGYINFKEEY